MADIEGSELFCVLEKDKKTYRYLLDCISYMRMKDSNSLMQLDNELQASEIAVHLKINGLSESDTTEKIRWIQKYGRGFREYLNTIKIAAITWCAKSEDKPTWEEFCNLTEQIDSTKKYLDGIHG